ncbi:MAG: response regulator transcription factor [Sulfurovum sp.]|nr:response regulator transcription factor [Sulfurovum sp.]
MKKLLLLEDDLVLQEIIEEHLLEQGYEVDCYLNGSAALDAALARRYDMLLLDVNVPEIDGFEMLGYLREIKNNTPVIFITSLIGIKSLQKGFELGANDYLKKPFELAELCVRIEHQLHVFGKAEELTIGPFHFYPDDQYLKKDEIKILLKQKEVQILLYFLRREGSIVSLDELIENVWSREQFPTYATIRTYIKNLRKALGSKAIENIKGSGYRLNKL